MQQMVRGGGADAMIDFFLGLQIWGTPDQCHDRIMDFTEKLGAETFTGVFSYAGMPYDMAENSMRLFASDVLPRLKAHQRVKAAAE
jgi:alkanesulfonate monooxygenase SsuD/methylene tetrahydromethanopterin reductase-like flavin-dependent oxidoreductase (luciferase family)